MSKMDDSVSTLLANVKKTNDLKAEIEHDVRQLQADYPWIKDPDRIRDAGYNVYLEIKKRQHQLSSKCTTHRRMLQDIETRLKNKMYHVYDQEDKDALTQLQAEFSKRKGVKHDS